MQKQTCKLSHSTEKRISASCYPEDTNKLRMIVWVLAAAVFFACSLLLVSGWCLQNSKSNTRYSHYKRSQLQYISTQMGACIDTHAYVTYGFVFAMVVHMLLLFDLLLHCMEVIPLESKRFKYEVWGICITRERLALGSGSLVIGFVINLAGVAEFNSDGQNTEQLFHYISAVGCIALFGAMHFVLCLYLFKFTLAPDYTYVLIRNVYFALTVIFFALWLLQIFFIVYLELAKIVEWIILLNGLLLQIYAEFSLYTHTESAHIITSSSQVYRQQQRFNTHLDTSVICAYVMFTFVCTFLVYLFSAPPWFIFGTRIQENLYTGPEFWIFVVATSLAVAVRLYSASFKASICDDLDNDGDHRHTFCFANGKCGTDAMQAQGAIAFQLGHVRVNCNVVTQ